MNRDKEFLERDYMKLKKIHREFIMMTMAILDNEEHYHLLKTTIPTIKRVITIMEKKINRED